MNPWNGIIATEQVIQITELIKMYMNINKYHNKP